MLFLDIVFQKKTAVFAGGILLAVCILFSCQHDTLSDTVIIPPPDDTVIVIPPVSIDSIFGKHSGECYYYRKQFDTGVETFDTTHESILEIVRVDSIWILASGCGAPGYFNWYLPVGSTDTMFAYSSYVGSNHYTMEISLADRTIATHHSFSALPFSPYFQIYDGKWKF